MAEAQRRSLQCALALLTGATLLFLAGCASGPRGGRDGAEADPPGNLGQVPDAEPRIESIRSTGGTSKPYVVMGRSYVPIVDDRPFRESGLASWYGTKFHRQSTASGEPYDMYAMTAAHKTLPLPSYVRVRNPANGREVIVRVNDRGPFRDDRIIDLSYTAALKLDLLRGVAPVEIERITNDDIRTGAWRRGNGDGTQFAQQAAPVARPIQVAAADSVAVPVALTAPVASTPRVETMEVATLPPMTPVAVPPSASLDASPSPAGPQAAASPSAGFWVQLGAFSQRDGAVRFQQQVAREMPGLAPSLNVFSERGVHRIQAGPYASRDLARDAADQVRNGLQLAPVIVERR
ncbi:MAG: septal ring lytic transglycosylase RlpA family protein [Variovorax sp.]|nr:septal ring lytic transglycosylase RlpA family protein [Variovorax sp.]